MRHLGMFAVGCALAGCSSDESGSGPHPDAGVDATADSPVDSPQPNDAGSDAPGDAATDAPLFAPSEKQLLSDLNPDHLDEDPSVILAADGSLLVAYFSQRQGNPDIYVKRTTDGVSWTETRVSTDPSADYYSSLYQDDSGVVHLTWFRWTAFQVGSIWHNSSPNGIDWDPDNETQVTLAPNVDDWVPTISGTAAGDLIITFASEKRNSAALSELYLSKKSAGASSWDAALPMADVNDPAAHETLPFVVRTGSELTLLYVKTDATSAVPWENASADVYLSKSSDGVLWSAPQRVTDDAPATFVDVFPGAFPDLAGKWSMIWISNKTAGGGAYVMPLDAVASYPTSAVANPIFEGYSPRAAPTPTPGVFLGVWVEADPVDENKKDVYYRFFSD